MRTCNPVNENMEYGLLKLFVDHNEDLLHAVEAGKAVKSTYTKYKTIRNKVAAFIMDKFQKEDAIVADLPHSFCDDLHRYLVDMQGLKHNTAVTYIEMLAKIFRLAIYDNKISVDLFNTYSYKKVQSTNLDYLSPEELYRIEELILQNERLHQVRDLFLFSCYTGLSYEEIKRASIYDIEVDEDGEFQWLHAKRGNSWGERIIPLLIEVEDIIEGYKEMREIMDSDKIFPFTLPSSTKNELREIGKRAGITRQFDFSIARYTFSLTYAVGNNFSTDLMSSILGGSLVEKTNQYQTVLEVEVMKSMDRLDEILMNKDFGGSQNYTLSNKL